VGRFVFGEVCGASDSIAAKVIVRILPWLSTDLCEVVAFPNEVALPAFSIGPFSAIDAGNHQVAIAPKVKPTRFERVGAVLIKGRRYVDSAGLRVHDRRLETFGSASPLHNRVMSGKVRPALCSGSNHCPKAPFFRLRKNYSRRLSPKHFLNRKLFEDRL